MLIFTESFETDGNGTRYTTSIPEFSDGAFDFFTRTDGSNIGGAYQVTNGDGSFFFAAQDLDGEGAASEQTLSFSGIDISGFTNLNFSALFAEDDDGNNQDWDDPDFVRVEYQIDGGGFENLFAIAELDDGDAFNQEPGVDTDFDGVADGSAITSTFTEFSSAIAGTGTSLDLRFTIDLDAGDEDIAIDNIQIAGDSLAADIALSSPAIAAASVLQGTTDRILYQLDLAVTTADAELTSATFTTGGTYIPADLAIDSFELFYSIDPIFDAGDTSLGTQAIVASGNNLNFTGLSQTINRDTTGTLFLVADIAAVATADNTINIAAPDLGDFTFTSANQTGTLVAGGVQTFDAIPAIAAISSNTSDGTFGVGDTVDVTVSFSENVTLAGGDLTINLDTGGTVSISPFVNSNTASGTYTVAAGENSADLDSNSPLVLASGATFEDATGNDVTLLVRAGQSLADNRDLVIDTTVPDTPSPEPNPDPDPSPELNPDPDPSPEPNPDPDPTPSPEPTPGTRLILGQLEVLLPDFPIEGTCGNDGDDLLLGDETANFLCGLGGNDILAGFGEADRLDGNDDNDLIFGNRGNDTIDGGTGDDLIFAGQDDDLVVGGDGIDVIAADIGNDTVDGNAGNDVLFGNSGADVLDGDDGDDVLFGGLDNDIVIGGAGNDVVSGDLGDDLLVGGAGGDRFDFRPGDGVDVVTDFTSGVDIIGLKEGLTFADLTLTQVADDTQITATGLVITLQGVDVGVLDAADFAVV